jgi:hypothetical protein
MQEHSKKVKQQMRELISLLYQRELQLELENIDQYFEQWRKGKFSPFELSEHIHEFHQNPSRELFSKYQSTSLFPTYVTQGIAKKILDPSEIPAETWKALENNITFWEREFKE